jgi:hypothetical protein
MSGDYPGSIGLVNYQISWRHIVGDGDFECNNAKSQDLDLALIFSGASNLPSVAREQLTGPLREGIWGRVRAQFGSVGKRSPRPAPSTIGLSRRVAQERLPELTIVVRARIAKKTCSVLW